MVEPQQIPFAPQQQNPVPAFQGGPYAQVASENIAKQPTSLDWMKGIGGVTNDALNSYLNQQRLQQQAPLVQAQTAEAQANTKGALQKQYWDQPTSPSLAGTSQGAPPPGGSYPGADQGIGASMSSSGGQGPTPGGGFSPQMPMSVQQSPAYSPSGQPNFQTGGNDPFAHMHMDPSQPGMLHGGPMGLQAQQAQAPQPMIQRSQLFGQQQSESAYQAEANALSSSPGVKSIFGRQLSSDELLPILRGSGQAGDFTKGLMQMEATKNQLAFKNQWQVTDKQVKAQEEGQKLYSDYVDKSQSVDAALDSLANAAKNPAMFNQALLDFAKANSIPITGRGAKGVIDVLGAGSPALLDQLNEAFTKGATGQMTEAIRSGLAQKSQAIKGQLQSGFERKATSHAQQNAQFFGGDVNQAKQALYPQYQWGGQGAQAGQGGQAGGQTLTATNKKTGQKVMSRDGGKTWQPAQ